MCEFVIVTKIALRFSLGNRIITFSFDMRGFVGDGKIQMRI